MPKTIRPDGSLDPVADFEDDGASFRQRREAALQNEFRPRDWSWGYLFSSPRSSGEAAAQSAKIFVKGMVYLILLFIGFVIGLIGFYAFR